MLLKVLLCGFVLISTVSAQSVNNFTNAINAFAQGLTNIPEFNEAIQIYCANPDTKTFQQVFINDRSTIKSVDVKRSVVFFAHGWIHDYNEPWIHESAKAILQYRNMNVCLVNWGNLAFADYFTSAVHNTRVVAKHLSDYIKYISRFGIFPGNITLVGFSLGAHIMGFVGQNFNGSIDHIIGLDPAGPLFAVPLPLPLQNRLDSTDAVKVQCIHSSDFMEGYSIPCGTLDFYGNLGVYPQPGCPRENRVRCSHYRATGWFQSSIKTKNQCNSIMCSGTSSYLTNQCTKQYNKLGFDANFKVNGKFYFATDGQPVCTGKLYNPVWGFLSTP